MLRLLQFVFFGHIHHWKILRHTQLNDWDSKTGQILGRGQRIVLQCERCGNVKSRDIL